MRNLFVWACWLALAAGVSLAVGAVAFGLVFLFDVLR